METLSMGDRSTGLWPPKDHGGESLSVTDSTSPSRDSEAETFSVSN